MTYSFTVMWSITWTKYSRACTCKHRRSLSSVLCSIAWNVKAQDLRRLCATCSQQCKHSLHTTVSACEHSCVCKYAPTERNAHACKADAATKECKHSQDLNQYQAELDSWASKRLRKHFKLKLLGYLFQVHEGNWDVSSNHNHHCPPTQVHTCRHGDQDFRAAH